MRCLLRQSCCWLPLPSTTAFLTLQVPAHWLAHPLPIPATVYHCSHGESMSLLHLDLHFSGLSWLGRFPHQLVRSLFCGLVFLAEPFPHWLCRCLASAGPHPVDGARQALQVCKACRHRRAGRGENCADLNESKQPTKKKPQCWLKRCGKNTQKNCTKKIFMAQIITMVWSLT